MKDRKKKRNGFVVMTILLLLIVLTGELWLDPNKLATDFEQKNLAPSFSHPFGTDWLGRDMLARTWKGLTVSLGVGILAAASSAFIALGISLCSTLGSRIDRLVTWLMDLFLSVPHLVSLILIAFALGGGFQGVVWGIALTHWPKLARVLRAEVLQLRSAEYVQVSRHLGKSRGWVMWHHVVPHLFPQFLAGLVLLFPHAILHEAAISFLGFGLSPQQPAIGIILSESMQHLSTGKWWLAFFPGLSLVLMVFLFDRVGNTISSPK